MGTTLQGSSTVGITSGVGVVPGQTVAGPGLAPGTKVTHVEGDTITLSTPTIADMTADVLSFVPESPVVVTGYAAGGSANGFVQRTTHTTAPQTSTTLDLLESTGVAVGQVL